MSEIHNIARELEQAKRDIQKLKNEIDKSPLRIEPASPIALSTQEIHWVICTEPAPDDRRWFWGRLLDLDGLPTGSDVQVYCTVIGLSNVMLNACVPQLSNDPLAARPIPVIKRPCNIEGKVDWQWHCQWWFNKSRECVCH